MKLKILYLVLLLSINVSGKDKAYRISVKNRNLAIELTNKARTLLKNNDAAKATPLIFKAIAIDSIFPNSYELLYKAITISENTSDSVLHNFTKAKRIFDEDDEVCFYKGEVYRMREDFVNAINEYSSAIEFSKNIPEKSFYYNYFFLYRATCNLKLKNYSIALTDYNTILLLEPQNSNAYVNRGICYKNTGKIELAKADMKRAAELGNTIATTYLQKLSSKPAAKKTTSKKSVKKK